MEERDYLIILYDFYGELLSVKQKEYFEDYYFHNMSFSEISEDYDVSRNAAFKQVHIVMQKLDEYEEKLKLFEKKNMIIELSQRIRENDIREELENLF